MPMQPALSSAVGHISSPRVILGSLWEFTRPHAMVGTALAVVVLYALAAAAAGYHDWNVLLLTAEASLGMHVYVVGVNQLTDVEIDRINKPYLPLASGALSYNAGLTLVILGAVTAVVAAAFRGPYLLATVCTIIVIGSAYSLPPLRLKRFPFWAASCIAVARAVVFNLGLALTYSTALGHEPRLSAPLITLMAYMLGHVTVIALMKDVPDIDGDRRHQIFTLVVRLGARRTMALCRAILVASYVGVIAVAMVAEVPGIHRATLVAGHVLALGALWWRGRSLDISDKDSIYSYYMFVWKLLYAEFGLFFAACMLG